MDDHGIHIRNIQPSLNYRCRHQHIDLTVDKIIHDPFQLMLLHLSVGKSHDSLRNQLLHGRRHICDCIDTVIYIIHLAVPGKLPDDRLPHHFLIVFADKGLDGKPVAGRLLQHAHIPDPHQRHMQCPGDRCGRKRKHIHIIFDFLYFFLMSHAETLFLINDQKSQILKLNIRRKDPVGPDDNIHLPLAQILHRFLLLRRRAEAGHQINPYRKVLQSLGKGIIVLLGQDGGRHQKRHLLPVLDSLKRRPYSYFCLSIAHIPANQTIHNTVAFHILFRSRNGGKLIIRFLKGKAFFKLLLPYRIFGKRIAFLLLPYGIKLHQILRHLIHGTAHPGFGTVPFLASQLIQLGGLRRIRGSILLDHIQPGGKHIQIAAVAVRDLDVILNDLIHLHLLNSLVNTQPMTFMDHIITYPKFGEVIDFLAFKFFLMLFLFLLDSENITFRDHHKFQQRVFEASFHMPVIKHHLAGIYHPFPVFAVKAGQPLLLQVFRQTPGPGAGAGKQQHPVSVFLIPFQIGNQCVKAAVIRGHAFYIDVKFSLWLQQRI